MASPPVVYKPMTDAERAAVFALTPVSYTPGCADKRFAKDMAYVARSEEGRISVRQREYLCRLVHRYRRQVPGWERLLAALKEEEASTNANP